MPENAMGKAPDQIAKGPEAPIVTKSPDQLDAQFAAKTVERDPSVVVAEQGKIDALKNQILRDGRRGVSPRINSLAMEGEKTRDVDNTRLDSARIAAGVKIAEAKDRAVWTAGIGGALGFSGGFLATGGALGAATGLAIGAAVAAVPVSAALIGYGIYKFAKNRGVKEEEGNFRRKWGTKMV